MSARIATTSYFSAAPNSHRQRSACLQQQAHAPAGKHAATVSWHSNESCQGCSMGKRWMILNEFFFSYRPVESQSIRLRLCQCLEGATSHANIVEPWAPGGQLAARKREARFWVWGIKFKNNPKHKFFLLHVRHRVLSLSAFLPFAFFESSTVTQSKSCTARLPVGTTVSWMFSDRVMLGTKASEYRPLRMLVSEQTWGATLEKQVRQCAAEKLEVLTPGVLKVKGYLTNASLLPRPLDSFLLDTECHATAAIG